jgi:Domain of unknown function (DUF4263)
MNILCTSTGYLTTESENTIEFLRKCFHNIEFIPSERLTSYLRLDPASQLALIDIIVCFADSAEFEFDFRSSQIISAVWIAIDIANSILELPDRCAMRNGRKWKSIPFAIIGRPLDNAIDAINRSSHTKLIFPSHPLVELRRIQGIVDDDHDRVLDDYEKLGILVRLIGGRTQIGPALTRRNPHLESEYYYAPADRRRHRSWVTIKRDQQGLRADVELFQTLLARGAGETELHRFFEEHPAALMDATSAIPISHRPSFVHPSRNTPDFALAPILGPVGGRNIGLVELKGPSERVLTGRSHRGLASAVHRAVDQVRDYDRYMRDPKNAAAVQKALGYIPERSRLAVLIGRYPTKDGDRGTLEQRRDELDVAVVTYDEILEIQTQRLELNKHYGL